MSTRRAPVAVVNPVPATAPHFVMLSKNWQDRQNARTKPRNWQFKTVDARIKLTKLYPTI